MEQSPAVAPAGCCRIVLFGSITAIIDGIIHMFAETGTTTAPILIFELLEDLSEDRKSNIKVSDIQCHTYFSRFPSDKFTLMGLD